MLTVTLHYSPALVRRSVFAYLRRGFGVVGFVALACLITAALLLVISAPGSWLAGAVSGAVAVLILLLIGLYLLHYRQGMAKLARMGPPHAVLQLTESEIHVSSQGGSFSAPWATFEDLWRFTDFWLIVIGKGQFMTLPLADLTDEAQTFIASHIRAKGQPANNAHLAPSEMPECDQRAPGG
ncbi:MAG: YcxB family protein [Candidatus Contendobacter sp.]